MSDKENKKSPNRNNERPKPSTDKGRQGGYIGENKGDFEKLHKGDELIPPKKPKKK